MTDLVDPVPATKPGIKPNAAEKLPWLKFYPKDWRANVRLRCCSLAARGLWIEILGLMHESEPYGSLLPAGSSPSAATIAMLIGRPESEVAPAIAELASAGVFSRTSSGVIISRRMVRDEQRRYDGRATGILALEKQAPPGGTGGGYPGGSRARGSEAQSSERNPPTPRKRGKTPAASVGWPGILPSFPSLDLPAVRSALEEWLAYRRARHLSVWVDQTWRTQLEEAKGWGPDGLVAAIKHTIRKGWMGLQRPSPEQGRGTKPEQGMLKTSRYLQYGSPEWHKANGTTPEAASA